MGIKILVDLLAIDEEKFATSRVLKGTGSPN